MFEDSIFSWVIVLGILAAGGVSIGVFSLVRRRKMHRLSSLGAQALEQGRHDEALRHLLAAERIWAFNSDKGNRKSLLCDLEDLEALINQLSALSSASSDTSPTSHIISVISELRDLLQDRNRYTVGGQIMKRETAVRWVELSDRLQTLRRELRGNYETPKTLT